VEASQLSAIFGQRASDLELLLMAMDVSEGDLTIQSAHQSLVDKFPESSDADFKDWQSVIDHVTSLMKHGRVVCQRISVYCGGKSWNFVKKIGTRSEFSLNFLVASALDLKYDYLVEHSRPVCILKMLLETPSGAACGPSATLSVGIGNHLSLARLWVTASRISSHEVFHLVREELTEAARTAHAETSFLGGSEPSNGMVVSLLRGQCKFSSFFIRLKFIVEQFQANSTVW
jgi:hypothetical protein